MPDVGLAAPTHVLIVEDDAPIRRFVRTALEGEGMHVTEADCALIC